jgi:DNA mismatch repair protein MutS
MGRVFNFQEVKKHFQEMKALHPDCLLFYHCGDFYETFFDDAKITARELDITLTSHNKDSDDPVPMAGISYQVVERATTYLIEKGYEVAICEQWDDPKQVAKWEVVSFNGLEISPIR